jgi:hypothetical protein
MTKKNTENPYKREEFEAFIQLIKGNTVAHWVQIATALGIDKTTITEWKRHPMAQKAIRDGIERATEEMEKAGKDDWKMWESKLKMLGVSPIEKSESDITSGGKPIPILSDVHTDNSDSQTPEADKEN